MRPRRLAPDYCNSTALQTRSAFVFTGRLIGLLCLAADGQGRHPRQTAHKRTPASINVIYCRRCLVSHVTRQLAALFTDRPTGPLWYAKVAGNTRWKLTTVRILYLGIQAIPLPLDCILHVQGQPLHSRNCSHNLSHCCRMTGMFTGPDVYDRLRQHRYSIWITTGA